MQKQTFVTKEKLQEIIQEYPTPFHLYDEHGIRETARAVNRAFAWNKGFREYYAVKACPNPYILSILREEGCGADCSSMAELKLSEAVGFRGEDIVFSSNETPDEEFAYARKLNALVNLDDETLIDSLVHDGGIPEDICLRYNPGGTISIGKNCQGQPGESKYGMTRPQIFSAVRRLMQMGAKRFGLHAFLASNTTERDYYPTMAKILFELARDVHKETGAEFFFIDLSGGIGIPYLPDQPAADIAQIGEGVRRAFEEVLVPAGMGEIRIAAELGRYMTGPHGCLVATAVHFKHIYKEYVGLDACAANLMRPAMYGAYHHITVAGKENAACDHCYDVVGSLCENNDKFAIDRMLPEIEIGDLLIIHDTGAHGFSMGYNYNGRLRSAEILLKEDGQFELIRRAETLDDYFATFDFCPYRKKLL